MLLLCLFGTDCVYINKEKKHYYVNTLTSNFTFKTLVYIYSVIDKLKVISTQHRVLKFIYWTLPPLFQNMTLYLSTYIFIYLSKKIFRGNEVLYLTFLYLNRILFLLLKLN